ncbi:putative LigA [Pseudomonas sp. OF001]|nr:putative LigA [Pseudomonas sp. OF001]
MGRPAARPRADHRQPERGRAAQAPPLQQAAAGRRALVADLRRLPEEPRPGAQLLHRQGHRRLRGLALPPGRLPEERRAAAGLRDLQAPPRAHAGAPAVRPRPARQGHRPVRLQPGREPRHRPREGALGRRQQGARRPVAQAREGRGAAPEDRRQGAQGHPGAAHQALPQPAQAPGADPQRGHLPGLHQRLRADLRPAHQLPVAGKRRELRHQHEPVAGRHRCGAAERQRARQDRPPGPRRPGGEEQAAASGRPHHRRRPGRQGDGRRDRLAPRRGGQADPRAQGLAGAPGSDSGQQRTERPEQQGAVDHPRGGQARGAGGEEVGAQARARGPRLQARGDRDPGLLPGLQGLSQRRPGIQEHHPRRAQAARRTQGGEGRRRGHRPAQQWRRLPAGGHRADRPVHRQGPDRAGAQQRRPRRRARRRGQRHLLQRSAGRAGQPPVGLRLGDLRRRHAGLPPRTDPRRADLRQGHRADHPAAQPRRAEADPGQVLPGFRAEHPAPGRAAGHPLPGGGRRQGDRRERPAGGHAVGPHRAGGRAGQQPVPPLPRRAAGAPRRAHRPGPGLRVHPPAPGAEPAVDGRDRGQPQRAEAPRPAERHREPSAGPGERPPQRQGRAPAQGAQGRGGGRGRQRGGQAAAGAGCLPRRVRTHPARLPQSRLGHRPPLRIAPGEAPCHQAVTI